MPHQSYHNAIKFEFIILCMPLNERHAINALYDADNEQYSYWLSCCFYKNDKMNLGRNKKYDSVIIFEFLYIY